MFIMIAYLSRNTDPYHLGTGHALAFIIYDEHFRQNSGAKAASIPHDTVHLAPGGGQALN
jgi:hypothetical protein